MLLIELVNARVACFICDWFVLAVTYTDDVVLLDLTARDAYNASREQQTCRRV
jgi:hypothetical protein